MLASQVPCPEVRFDSKSLYLVHFFEIVDFVPKSVVSNFKLFGNKIGFVVAAVKTGHGRLP